MHTHNLLYVTWMNVSFQFVGEGGGGEATSNIIVPSDDAGRGAAQWLKAAYAECTRDG